jgi:hypothetical protein
MLCLAAGGYAEFVRVRGGCTASQPIFFGGSRRQLNAGTLARISQRGEGSPNRAMNYSARILWKTKILEGGRGGIPSSTEPSQFHSYTVNRGRGVHTWGMDRSHPDILNREHAGHCNISGPLFAQFLVCADERIFSAKTGQKNRGAERWSAAIIPAQANCTADASRRPHE